MVRMAGQEWVALYSLTSPLSAAGVRTLIPRLLPEDALDRANALDTSSYALIDVLGPALAGSSFGFAGAHVTMLAIAMLYGVACPSLLPLARRKLTRPIRPCAASPSRTRCTRQAGASFSSRCRSTRHASWVSVYGLIEVRGERAAERVLLGPAHLLSLGERVHARG